VGLVASVTVRIPKPKSRLTPPLGSAAPGSRNASIPRDSGRWCWLYVTYACLSCIGLLIAASAVGRPAVVLLALPLVKSASKPAVLADPARSRTR
jgi:hypothetical protein